MAPGQEAPAPPSTPSPGNEYSPDVAPLRMPHLEFIYRIVVAMDKDPGAVTAIPNAQGLDVTRMVLPIAGGTVRGPLVRGEIVKNSGADWAQRIANSSKPYAKLNARYTLKTDDGHFILVNCVGTFIAGPDGYQTPSTGQPMTATQDDVEYFTQITFEASGAGPYAWMNSAVAVGVMTMAEGKPIIDCYRLTNFPGRGTTHL